MIPSIRTADVPRAVEFYAEKLGFTVARPSEGNVALVLGDDRVMIEAAADFYSPEYNDAIRGRLGGPSPHALYFEVAELDAYYSKLETAGVEIVDPLAPRPWGQAEFTVADCDGNWLTFWHAL